MPLNRLTQYLEENNAKYAVLTHPKTYTASETAESTRIPGKKMAKAVIAQVDGDMKMIVLPATHEVDFNRIRDVLQAEEVRLADEDEFRDLFPDCEVGAMPPFGNLYDIDTLVDESLSDGEEIVFNAGSHREAVRMSYKDFEKLVNPQVLSSGVRKV